MMKRNCLIFASSLCCGSNPYTGAERPGTAAAVVTLKDNKVPVSGTFDPNATPELLAEHQHIKDILLELASSLNAAPLTPADKRQLAEAEKGIAILLKRLSRFDIDADVTDKVDNMVSALKNRDYAMALAVQTALVNSDWKNHKDWLKGMKFLIQLASKRSQ
jgi:protein transport protein SEC31